MLTLPQWKIEIDEKIQKPEGTKFPVVLIGNKSDLDNADVNKGYLADYCKKHDYIGWFDTSAKLNTNIDEAMYCLVNKIMSSSDSMLRTTRVRQVRFSISVYVLIAVFPSLRGSFRVQA